MQIWLDDKRNPIYPNWVWVKTAEEAIQLLEQHGLEITDMSFDHDLGTELDGHDVATKLESLAFEGKINRDIRLSIQSSNSVGARELKQALGSALRFFERRPEEVIQFDYLALYEKENPK